jgi:WD40 repeat protein
MHKLNISLHTTLKGHTSSIYTIAGRGDDLYSTGGDGQVVRWNLAEPADGVLMARMGMQIFSMALMPDARHMLLGQMHGGIHVLDLEDKQEDKHLALHTQGIFDLLTIDNHFVAAGGDGILSLWRTTDYSLGLKIALSDASLRALALRPDGLQLAVGSSDNGIYLLSLPDFKITRKLEGHENSVFTLCYSPDGRYLLSGSRDAHLMVWDVVNDYKLTHRIPAHLFTINHIVYSPDGQMFATAGRDKDVKVWDANTFTLLKVLDRHKFDGHINSVNRLCWSERYLVSAGDDRVIKLWKVS